jgi:hypothetical protein
MPAGPVATVVVLTTTAALAYIFYMGFMKFYRRFTLEALMAVAVTFQAGPIRADQG